jgi:hypothetical protein
VANTELVTRLEYRHIRSAIDLAIDDEALPDDVISLPIFLGRARVNVKYQDVLWRTRTGDEWQHLVNATVYFTAAYLVLPLVRNDQETFGTRWAFKRTLIDPETLSTTLAGIAQTELDAVLNVGSLDAERPTMFTLANAGESHRIHRWNLDG